MLGGSRWPSPGRTSRLGWVTECFLKPKPSAAVTKSPPGGAPRVWSLLLLLATSVSPVTPQSRPHVAERSSSRHLPRQLPFVQTYVEGVSAIICENKSLTQKRQTHPQHFPCEMEFRLRCLTRLFVLAPWGPGPLVCEAGRQGGGEPGPGEPGARAQGLGPCVGQPWPPDEPQVGGSFPTVRSLEVRGRGVGRTGPPVLPRCPAVAVPPWGCV